MQTQVMAGWRCAMAGPVPLAGLVEAAQVMAKGETPAGTGVRELKRSDRSLVVAIELQGQRWIIKMYTQPGWKAWLGAWLRVSPAWREMRGGQRLATAGLAVAAPVALLQRGHRAAVVAPFVEGPTVAELLKDHGRDPEAMTDEQRRLRLTLARAMGVQTGTLLQAGLVNRDYKPTNLIVSSVSLGERPESHSGPSPDMARGSGADGTDESAGGQALVMIDPLGVRRRQSVGGYGQAVRMVAVLGRSVQRAGTMTRREVMTCLRATVRTGGPGVFGRGAGAGKLRGRAAALGRAALAVNRARPLSWGPADD